MRRLLPPSVSVSPYLLIVASTLAGIFLAGGLRELGLGFVLLGAGWVMIRSTPARSVSPVLWCLGSGIALCGFLPLILKADAVNAGILSGMFPSEVRWPLTVEPVTTLSWSLLLVASILLALHLLSSPVSSEGLHRAAVLMVAGVLAYGILSLIFWKSGSIPPAWLKEPQSEPSFGLFPNRNHTAGFLLTGGILSAGLMLDGINRGKFLSCLLGGISLAFLSTLLLACSQSRAGVLFFGIGLAIWIVGLGRRRPVWLTLFAVVFTIALAVLFSTSQSPLMRRISSSLSSAADGGPRLELAADTMRMVSESPVWGHGKGTYELLYPRHADRSLRYATTALHPESDWLLLLHDDGAVALLLVIVSLGFCLAGLRNRKDEASEGSWVLRWAMASAFLAEILHSFIDVPLHRVELGWWILLLGGFSMSGWLAITPARRWEAFAFRAGGGLFLLGSGWLFLSLTHLMPPPPPFESLRSREWVLRLYGAVPFGEAGPVLRECERLLRRYPMNTELAHQYATFLIQEKTDLPKAKALFATENILLPHDADTPFQQGWILIDDDPSDTVTLWKEALSRQSRMDALPGNPVPRTAELFRNMMQVAAEHPSMQGRTGDVASFLPETRLLWVTSPSSPVPDLELAAQDQAFMAALTPIQRGRVLESLWARGDRNKLRTLVESLYPSAPESLPIRARILADSGRAKEACGLIVDAYSIPLPHPPGASALITPAGNDVPKDPLQAARYYLGNGNSIAARRYLEESRGTSDGAPGEYYLLAANIAMDEGKWTDALPMLLAFLDATGKR